MAQSFATKQANFVQRLSAAVQQLMSDRDTLVSLFDEFTANSYGSGGTNALTDPVVQGVLPAATALLVSEAMGVIGGSGGVLPVIAANDGYLQLMRP
jgi:hypothetical protein